MIKKIKVGSIFVNESKEITSKKDGKKYDVCDVNIKVADDSKEYAGKYIKIGVFGFTDPKDPKKNKTSKEKADYFKSQNNGKEIILEVNERAYTDKDGMPGIALDGKVLSKAKAEVAAQLLK